MVNLNIFSLLKSSQCHSVWPMPVASGQILHSQVVIAVVIGTIINWFIRSVTNISTSVVYPTSGPECLVSRNINITSTASYIIPLSERRHSHILLSVMSSEIPGQCSLHGSDFMRKLLCVVTGSRLRLWCRVWWGVQFVFISSLETWLSPGYVPVCWPCQHTAETFSPIWRLSVNYQTQRALTAFIIKEFQWVNTNPPVILVFWNTCVYNENVRCLWLSPMIVGVMTHERVLIHPPPSPHTLTPLSSCQQTAIKQ